MIKHINSNFKDHTVLFADFDSFINLSKKQVYGINAPLIAQKLEDPTKQKEFDTFLIERAEADICFPTDFYLLQHMYEKVTNKKGTVFKNKDFVEKYSLQGWADTKNGFNPMKEEYINTSIFTSKTYD